MRVILAEDEGLLREGLARLLADAGFEVIGKAADAATLLRLVDARLPDVVLTDIRMPPGHSNEGLVAAEQIRDRHPQIGVLVLSHHVDSRYAMRLIGNFPQRSGYLLKERVSEVAVLADALRRISEGECVIDPTIVSRLMSRGEHGGALADLTEREREVLSLIRGSADARHTGVLKDACEQGFWVFCRVGPVCLHGWWPGRCGMRVLLGRVGGRREVVEARWLGQLERLEDLALGMREFGALGDGALAGGERDEVHAVELVADVAPAVCGLGLGDAQQQQRQPADLDVRLDAVLAAVVDGA